MIVYPENGYKHNYFGASLTAPNNPPKTHNGNLV